jgi:hypothetical protein
MWLTDWLRWPLLSHQQSCRNALRHAREIETYRRELEDAERFVDEVARRRRAPDPSPSAAT